MSAHRCKACKGIGKTGPEAQHGRVWQCFVCDGEGRVYEWAKPVKYHLSNSDLDSDPVGVSNIRVWQRDFAESEGQLWRTKYGIYGSEWIEVRKEIETAREDQGGRALLRRAQGLGLTQLSGIIEALNALEQYPILDDDDESEAEQEEQEKHWESYGRSDLERALRNLDENLDDNFEACLEATGRANRTLDDLYWAVCQEQGKYPERIDSSAWDFGIESRRSGIRTAGGWAVMALYDLLVPEHMRGLTPEEFSVVLDARLEGNETESEKST